MDVGAIEVLFTWQTLVLAMMVAVVTQIVKAIVDVAAGGTEKRKKIGVLTRVVLPLVPLLLGAVLGALVPIQPETLLSYAEVRKAPIWAVSAPWGFVVGILSDYLYSKVMKRIKLPTSKSGETG